MSSSALGDKKSPDCPRLLFQLGDRYLFAEVNILNGVRDRYAFLHRALEGLAPRNKPRAAGALVDHGRFRRFGHIALAFTGSAGMLDSLIHRENGEVCL